MTRPASRLAGRLALVALLALAAVGPAPLAAQAPSDTAHATDGLLSDEPTQQDRKLWGTKASVAASQRADRLRTLPAEAITPPRPYVRERWAYPAAGRLDPMQPPAAVASPDAFPDLALSGIVFDTQHPERSTALVRVSGRTTGPKVERLVVQAGDRIDLIRIVRVERARVLVEVRLLGGAQEYYLEHPKPGQSAGPGR